MFLQNIKLPVISRACSATPCECGSFRERAHFSQDWREREIGRTCDQMMMMGSVSPIDLSTLSAAAAMEHHPHGYQTVFTGQFRLTTSPSALPLPRPQDATSSPSVLPLPRCQYGHPSPTVRPLLTRKTTPPPRRAEAIDSIPGRAMAIHSVTPSAAQWPATHSLPPPRSQTITHWLAFSSTTASPSVRLLPRRQFYHFLALCPRVSEVVPLGEQLHRYTSVRPLPRPQCGH